jgi:hypothetical protein
METVATKYRIYRYINDISINGKEFICEDDGSIKLFDSEDHAKAFIKEGDPSIDVEADDLLHEYGLTSTAEIHGGILIGNFIE